MFDPNEVRCSICSYFTFALLIFILISLTWFVHSSERSYCACWTWC